MTGTDFPTEQELKDLRRQAINKMHDADTQWVQGQQAQIVRNVKLAANCLASKDVTFKFSDVSMNWSDLTRRCQLIKTWMDQTKMAYTLTETKPIFILTICLDFLPQLSDDPNGGKEPAPKNVDEPEKCDGGIIEMVKKLDEATIRVADPDHPRNLFSTTAHIDSLIGMRDHDEFWMKSYIKYFKKVFMCEVGQYNKTTHILGSNPGSRVLHVVIDDANAKRTAHMMGWFEGINVAALGYENAQFVCTKYASNQKNRVHLVFDVNAAFVQVAVHLVNHW